MSLDQMVPARQGDQLECPREYENVFYIDDQNLQVCVFSNITGKQTPLFSIEDFVSPGNNQIVKKSARNLVFTDIQMRQDHERGIIKFLISWINAQASSPDKKHLFTWISYDTINGRILQDQSNND